MLRLKIPFKKREVKRKNAVNLIHLVSQKRAAKVVNQSVRMLKIEIMTATEVLTHQS